jgi:YfiH family protein
MIARETAGLRYFQFDSLLSENLFQAVFSRQGGVSPDPWSSLNLGSTVGDDPVRVSENKSKLLAAIGYFPGQLAQIHQVHSAHVEVVNKPVERNSVLVRGDAMISNTPGLLMLMRFADCVPILFFDPVKNTAGIAHAGWEGTVKEVVIAAVKELKKQFGTDPSDLITGIGPSIGPDHYEIGEDVIEEVKITFPDNWEEILIEGPDSVKLDLWEANKISLKKAGVRHIETAEICTACNVKDWYSHRAENGRTGRFAAVIGLK